MYSKVHTISTLNDGEKKKKKTLFLYIVFKTMIIDAKQSNTSPRHRQCLLQITHVPTYIAQSHF